MSPDFVLSIALTFLRLRPAAIEYAIFAVGFCTEISLHKLANRSNLIWKHMGTTDKTKGHEFAWISHR